MMKKISRIGKLLGQPSIESFCWSRKNKLVHEGKKSKNLSPSQWFSYIVKVQLQKSRIFLGKRKTSV